MNKICTFLTAVILTVGLSSCASLTEGDRIAQIKLGLDVVMLDRELDAALEAFEFNNWTPDEEKAYKQHLGELQLIRNGLNDLVRLRAEGVNTLISIADTRTFLDNVATHFNALSALYAGMVNREGIVPDQTLTNYENSGVNVWRALDARVKANDNSIRAAELQDFLTYVVRGYVLYKAPMLKGSL